MSDSENPGPDVEVTVRRVPKYGAFMTVGAGIAAIATFIATNLFPVDPNVGFGPLFGYFLLFAIPAGVTVGALIALGLDRAAAKRAKTVIAQREGAAE